MKNLTFLLIVYLFSVDISAQHENSYSREQLKKELSHYSEKLKSFDEYLRNVPNDFNPQSLINFEEYIDEEPQLKIITLEKTYSDLIEYLRNYENYHGAHSFEVLVNSESNNNSNLPPCYKTWYFEELTLAALTLRCCDTIENCTTCIKDGILLSYSNKTAHKDCLKEYSNPK